MLDETNLDMLNGTMTVNDTQFVCSTQILLNGRSPEEIQRYAKEEEANAVWYIIFVLSFYALSIVILLVKYVRKERDHARFNYYYDEFVKREAFKSLVCDQNGKVIGHPYELCKVRVMTFEQLQASRERGSSDVNEISDGAVGIDMDGDSDGYELQADVDGCLDDEKFALSCKETVESPASEISVEIDKDAGCSELSGKPRAASTVVQLQCVTPNSFACEVIRHPSV